MEEKKFHFRNAQVCGRCGGDGVVKIESGHFAHGSSDDTELIECDMCLGKGIVDVIKDVTLTIVPHNSRK